MLLIALLVTSCTIYNHYQLNKTFGAARPIDHRQIPQQDFSYWNDVQPILEKRCVVCHGCYDAPCQLKLSAFEGLARGASKNKVYDGKRLIAANLTRLFEDGHSLKDWRDKSFFPVLNERQQSPKANTEGGVMYQMLALKEQNPLITDNQILPDHFDFSLKKKHACSKIEEFPSFANEHPNWGMPYALPGLDKQEHNVVSNWLKAGAPYREKSWIPAGDWKHIKKWEDFFNGESLKQQLTSRYLYEHLFLSHLYFNDVKNPQFYRLVRSSTPPPKTVQQIATRRPFDDPAVDRVFYRLLPVKTSILAKTHMPYLLDAKRMTNWQQWFIDADYSVDQLPNYDSRTASNPFIAFKDLPQLARYRFLLDEAQHTIMGFIKGPVCRGQIALNVIDDHFWVAFVDPDSNHVERTSQFLVSHSDLLRLPAEQESNPNNLASWLFFSQRQKKFLQAKTDFLNEMTEEIDPAGLEFIWDGDQQNDNYGLTIFRHFDSASVVKGFVGQTPKTAWLIDYSLLERIHYLLVAGFDVYGNAIHQLNTRLYMDFLRMEGEFNFLAFMPQKRREQLRDYWYRGATADTKDFVYGAWAHFAKNTGIPFSSKDPKAEFFQKLVARSPNNTNRQFDLAHADIPAALREKLDRLNNLRGKAYGLLPHIAFIQIKSGSNAYYFTLIKNIGHLNVTHLFNEEKALAPDEHYLTLVPGFLGAYPNSFFSFNASDVDAFIDGVRRLRNSEDYRNLADRFLLRRSAANFWEFSDQLHSAYYQQVPVEAGLFDFNRLENR